LILVTVGTHHQGFNRLVQPMDELAADLDEPVVIQRGSSTYEPRYAEHFQWTTSWRMEQLTQQARVVVTHAAAGAIILSLLKDKPLVVVPRLRCFSEHTDDHQQQLATALGAEGKAIVVQNPSADTLRAAIAKVTRRRAKNQGAARLVQAIRDQLNQWDLTDTQPNTIQTQSQ